MIKGEIVCAPCGYAPANPATLVNDKNMLASTICGSGGGKAGNACTNYHKIKNHIISHARHSKYSKNITQT
jgi:hypothetical protein